MLADVEDDFQPAGSIGPEVELVFDEPETRFDEEFEEEEVVADRYVPAAEPPGDPVPEKHPGSEEDHVPEDVDAGDHPPAEAEDDLPQEPAMIGVEDDYDDTQPATCPIVAVRRQEYRHLFARLRRG